MAIQIIQALRADPARFRLPRRIDLGMTLSSSEASERCRFVYLLPEDNDVVFDDGTKRDERVEKVARAATPIAHRLNLRQREEGTKPASFQLTQEVFDEVGTRTRSRITLTLDRSPQP